jgi:hypothetical protein
MHSSRRDAPELCIYLSPQGGRGECRVPAAPAASCALVLVKSTRVTTSTPESPSIPARNGFNGLCRALPGDRALLPPSSRGLRFSHCPVGPKKPPQDLTPASGRQDHTILPSATTSLVRVLVIAHEFKELALQSRRTLNAAASTASRPNVRDDHDTPLSRAGMRKVLEMIWGVWEGKYFCKWDSTRLSTNRPTGKSLEPVLLSIRRMG